MNKEQKDFLTILTANNGSIKKALDETGVNMTALIEWQAQDDFTTELNAAKELANVLALDVLQQLAAGGNAQAAIKVTDILRKGQDNTDQIALEDKVMSMLFEFCSSNSDSQSRFKEIFNTTQYAAVKVFNRVSSTGAVQPSKKAADAASLDYSLLSSRFDRGELSEVDLMQSLMSNALRESEVSTRADVRGKASQLVIQLHERLETIEERKRRAAEQDETSLIDTLDAQLSGVHPSSIEALREKYRGDVKAVTG